MAAYKKVTHHRSRKRLGRVRANGKLGQIVSAHGQRLKVVVEGHKRPRFFHPWDLDYLDRNGIVVYKAQ